MLASITDNKIYGNGIYVVVVAATAACVFVIIVIVAKGL